MDNTDNTSVTTNSGQTAYSHTFEVPCGVHVTACIVAVNVCGLRSKASTLSDSAVLTTDENMCSGTISIIVHNDSNIQLLGLPLVVLICKACGLHCMAVML